MAASPLKWRPVAIALVVQDTEGNMHIIGSKDVKTFEIEMTQSADGQYVDLSCYSRPRDRNFHFEADCSSALWQMSHPAPLPPQIEQRGIYLPNMSFRALPGPEES